MKPWVILAILGVVAFIGFAVVSSMNGQKVRANVCIVFKGQKDCRIAVGATEEEAVRAATSTACGILASGMTETMACERTEAISVSTQPVR